MNEVHDAQALFESDAITVRLDHMYQEYVQIGTADPVASGAPVLVQNEHFRIAGTDYTDFMSTPVSTAHYGQPIGGLLRKGLRRKVKQMRNFIGTVEDD